MAFVFVDPESNENVDCTAEPWCVMCGAFQTFTAESECDGGGALDAEGGVRIISSTAGAEWTMVTAPLSSAAPLSAQSAPPLPALASPPAPDVAGAAAQRATAKLVRRQQSRPLLWQAAVAQVRGIE